MNLFDIFEGAIDDLEARRIEDLNAKMDDLTARAKSTSDPRVKEALRHEFARAKAERDSYYKINVDEAPGAETLAHNQNTVADNEKAFDLEEHGGGGGGPREWHNYVKAHRTDEVADTNYTYTVFIDGTKEGTYGSKEEAKAVVARKKQQAPGRDYRIAPKSRTSAASIKRFQKNRDRTDEGWQDFNKVEPYAVCLAGKPVKKFDYYEEARRFHDNWKQKLYREGNKEKADKITLMPLNLGEAYSKTPANLELLKDLAWEWQDGSDTALDQINQLGWNISDDRKGVYIIKQTDMSGRSKIYFPELTAEAANPAQQAAIAINMKKHHQKPKQVDEDYGSWIVYDPATKEIKKRFKTHTAGKSYAKVHNLGFASSEYYFDNVKEKAVAEGAKVDRMQKHIAKSEKDLGHSKKDAEAIGWATLNKRGYLDNKNKKTNESLEKVPTEKLKALWNQHKDEQRPSPAFAQQLRLVAKELARRKDVDEASMDWASHKSTGPKFSGYLKGTDPAPTEYGNKSFGAESEEMEEGIAGNMTVKSAPITQPLRQRNFVAKNAIQSGAGKHANQLKKAAAAGRHAKHKGQPLDLDEGDNFLTWAVRNGYNLTKPAVYESARNTYKALVEDCGPIAPHETYYGAMDESLKKGEYYVWTVYFDDGTSKRIKVTSDEFDPYEYYAKQKKNVINVDYNWEIQQ